MNNIGYIGKTPIPGIYHIGMTHDGRSPYERWKDYDYRAKLPYVPKKVGFFDIQNLTDNRIKSILLKNEHIRLQKDVVDIRSDEIYVVDLTEVEDPDAYIIEIYEDALRYLLQGVRRVDNFFVPRPHQEWVNSVILDRFYNHHLIQLLDACAREGKTGGGLYLWKQTGFKVMCIIGYWLAGNESFSKFIDNNYDITSDVAIIKPDYDELQEQLALGKRVLIDISLHNSYVDPRLIEYLSKNPSLIFVDEADFGAWTNNSNEIKMQYVNSGKHLTVFATGTNIDRAMIGLPDSVPEPITVSYLDLLEAKRGQGFLFGNYDGKGEQEIKVLEEIRKNPYEWSRRLSDIVEISCLSLDANESFKEDSNNLDETERANMKKMFSKRNSHLQRESIRQLYSNDFGTDIFTLYSTHFKTINKPAVMQFISATKEDLDNLAKIGQSVDDSICWIVLHGDEENMTNRKAEDYVKSIIKKSNKERFVILSCGMGSRSFSVPNIIAVVNCSDGGTIGSSIQKASRCLTPGADKESAFVINYSFDTNRSSTFETDLISSAIKYDKSSDVQNAIRRVYGLVNFMKVDEHGYPIKLTEDNFVSHITSAENLTNMALATLDKDRILSCKDIFVYLLKDVKRSKGITPEVEKIIEGAKTYIETCNKSSTEIDPNKKEIRDLFSKIQMIVKTVGNAYWLTPEASTFISCLEMISSNSEKDAAYRELVGIPASTVQYLINFLPKDFMDLIVMKAKTTKKVQNVCFEYVSDTSFYSILNPQSEFMQR
jgi:hypothetical protein